MIKICDILAPLDYDDDFLLHAASKRLMIPKRFIGKPEVVRRSVDARKADNICFNLAISVKVDNESAIAEKLHGDGKITIIGEEKLRIPPSRLKKNPVVIGFGPAGIFAAYILALAGAEPIVIERGEPIEKRGETVKKMMNFGVLDKESNIQFGEGGAGAFSDGKLNTGTNSPVNRHILEAFVEFGAPRDILIDAKPHIGTDMLKPTIINMRKKIIEYGGKIIFNAKFTGFAKKNERLSAIQFICDGALSSIETDAAILAIGHSARDTFERLFADNIIIEQKCFAVGVRIEHLREDINNAMYGRFSGHPLLGAADYKFAIQPPQKRSLYSFCMCPGGVVVPAASEENRLVTNGMSYLSRSEKNSNSALLMPVTAKDIGSNEPLAAVEFQRKLESAAFAAGGGGYAAPVSLVGDFLKDKISDSFGRIMPSYLPNVKFALPQSYLPESYCMTLKNGIRAAGRRITGFDATDAVLTGVETRSSSPVRIVRGETLCSVSLDGLYPCGEGAGYAGGIMSAAADGIRCAMALLERK